MNPRDKEKSDRPFYELPPTAHFKPCSKIIKEARMQLKYSAKVGSDVDSKGSIPHLGSPTTMKDEYESNDYSSSIAGIRPIQTKRPFTPRDSLNLWGASARKRPPSAITLSRLSLDEIEEQVRPGSSAKQNFTSGPQKFSLDSVYNGSEDSDGKKMTDLTRRKFKSLSLSKDDDSEKYLAAIKHDNGGGDNFLRANLSEPTNPYEEINNLEIAIEYLDSLLEHSNKLDQPPVKSDLIGILKSINRILSNANVLGKKRSKLLKLLFKLVEKTQTDDDILFWSAFILLRTQIVGNNLTTVFKMIFKASKSKDYFQIIKESDFVETFLRALGKVNPITHFESMIYGYGVLKFICNEDDILFGVIDLNLIEIMTLHLTTLNEEIDKRKGGGIENFQNAIFQLTSILRTVVGVSSSLDNICSSGLLNDVCVTLSYTMKDVDIVSNIVRILSVVSEHDGCIDTLVNNSNLCGTITNILQTWHDKEDVILRLMYCLGNLLGKSPEMRIKLYNEPLSYQLIIQLICYYLENETTESEDILIKSIRLLANWSLDPDIGAELCDDKQLNEIIYMLLTSDKVSNELLICTIATLNNLSYYKDYTSLDETSEKIVNAILGFINLQDLEVRTEVTKVLGNLTRNVDVRKNCSEYVGVLLLSLEESDENSDLLCATIGVLINVIADTNCKKEFIQKQGLQFLIGLLEKTHNVRLALMISQLLWNLILSTTLYDPDGHQQTYFQEEELHELSQTILKKMEEFGNMSESPSDDNMYSEACIDFLSISSNLFEKLSSI